LTAHSETDGQAVTSAATDGLAPIRRRKPNVRIREMTEWNGILVYTPDNPNVFYLNSTSWMVLELIDNVRLDEARARFRDLMADCLSPSEADTTFDEGLAVLEEKGVVELVVA
jgi:hypothetical protein